MELLHDELLKEMMKQYPGFELDRVIELVKVEALLQIASTLKSIDGNGINCMVENTDW